MNEFIFRLILKVESRFKRYKCGLMHLKLLAIFLLLLTIELPAQDIQSADTLNQTENATVDSIPLLDFSAGVGFRWLLQANLTINLLKFIYIQPRASLLTLLSADYEFGLCLVSQIQMDHRKYIRVGAGISSGRSTTISFYTGKSESPPDEWNRLYIRCGLLICKDNNIINEPNINVIFNGGNTIFSLNYTWGLCEFQ